MQAVRVVVADVSGGSQSGDRTRLGGQVCVGGGNDWEQHGSTEVSPNEGGCTLREIDSVVVDGAEKKRKLRGKGNCLEEAGLSKMRVSGNKLA